MSFQMGSLIQSARWFEHVLVLSPTNTIFIGDFSQASVRLSKSPSYDFPPTPLSLTVQALSIFLAAPAILKIKDTDKLERY